MPLVISAIETVYGGGSLTPQMALSFCTKLMNSTVVTLMRASQDAGRPDQLKMTHSERALEVGLCKLFILFLCVGVHGLPPSVIMLCQQNPHTLRARHSTSPPLPLFLHISNRGSFVSWLQVSAFMSSAKNRTKKSVPDIGDFLVLLLLAKQTWGEVAAAVRQRKISESNKPISALPSLGGR